MDHCYAAAFPSHDGGGVGAYLFSAYDHYTLFGSQHARTGSFLRCELDGTGWRQNTVPNLTPDITGLFCAAGYSRGFLEILHPGNLQPILAPVVIMAGRPSNFLSVIGAMPHVRYLRIDNYESGEIIQVGAQKWIAFPHTNKNHSTDGWCIKYDGP